MSPTILILDDEELIRFSLGDYFEDLGWTVLAAESAEEAETIIAEKHVDYATVDLRLGGMNGADFALAVKKKYPGIRILLFTGSFNYKLSEEMQHAGFSEKNILMKPIEKNEAIVKALLKIEN
jgi:DNA-binding NtrC family response regulator